jgi:uncharacterized protein involved in tolerance to divalent cations
MVTKSMKFITLQFQPSIALGCCLLLLVVSFVAISQLPSLWSPFFISVEKSSKEITASLKPSSMFSVCYVTVPDAAVGRTVANALVTSRLAACVNMVPGVTSFYEWKGKMEEGNELMLMIKTRSALVSDVIQAVHKVHPYECPEVISMPLGDSSQRYLDWIAENTLPTAVPLQPEPSTPLEQERK